MSNYLHQLLSIFHRTARIRLLSLSIGAGAGLIYWKHVGCISGGCILASSWLFNAVFGALIGNWATDFILKPTANTTESPS